MRVRLDSTSCETSLIILAFSLGDSVVNHFARRYSARNLLFPESKRQQGGGQVAYHFALP